MPGKYFTVTKSGGYNVRGKYVSVTKVEDEMCRYICYVTKNGGCNVPAKFVTEQKVEDVMCWVNMLP